MADSQPSAHEWSERIMRLATDLGLTQAGLADRIGVSPATVSRWIQGKYEPTAEGYVALGNLAQRADAIYFWERAGIDTSAFPETSFGRAQSSVRVNLHDFTLIASRRFSKPLPGTVGAVAIPLLNVSAYGDPVPPTENVSLPDVKVQEVLLAPLSWCPHPENMISMHLTGDSMVPTISPGSILFVDTADVDRDHLIQKITVVSHRDRGFKVGRFQRLANADLMVSSNHKYVPLDISNASKWKIFGEVLWWISRDIEPAS